MTALHAAISTGNNTRVLAVVVVLLEAGADVNLKDEVSSLVHWDRMGWGNKWSICRCDMQKGRTPMELEMSPKFRQAVTVRVLLGLLFTNP